MDLRAFVDAALTSSLILASCSAELIAPTSVFLSSGSPTRRVARRRLRRAVNSLAMLSWTKQTRSGAADVALVEEDAVDDAFDGLVDGGVVEDDVGGLAAEFEGELFAGAGEGVLDDFADFGGAGEGDLGGERMVDDGGSGFTGAGDDVDDAGRQVRRAARMEANLSAVMEVVSAGLMTTVFPVARAGAIFHASISSGKFHGITWPTTPSGQACDRVRRSRVCPPSRRDRRNARRPSAGRSRAIP